MENKRALPQIAQDIRKDAQQTFEETVEDQILASTEEPRARAHEIASAWIWKELVNLATMAVEIERPFLADMILLAASSAEQEDTGAKPEEALADTYRRELGLLPGLFEDSTIDLQEQE